MVSAQFVRAEAEGTSKRMEAQAQTQAWVERGAAQAPVCGELCPRIMVGVSDNVVPCRDFTGRRGGAAVIGAPTGICNIPIQPTNKPRSASVLRLLST